MAGPSNPNVAQQLQQYAAAYANPADKTASGAVVNPWSLGPGPGNALPAWTIPAGIAATAATPTAVPGSDQFNYDFSGGARDYYHGQGDNAEAVIPLDLSGLGVTTSTYTGPSPGQIQAQLGAQIAGLQAAGNRASGDIGGLYNALAGQLSRYIPLENAAYNQEYGRVGGLFGGLDRSIQQTYGTSLRDIQGEMQRLGIANRMPVATAPMLSDEALTRANTGNLAGGTLGALRLLQAGANTYNRDVVGMARTEGANRQADIRQGILAAIINARQQNAAAVAKAAQAAAKGTKTVYPTKPSDLLREIGGVWGSKGLAALNSYLNSTQVQQQGRWLTHQVPVYSKNAQGVIDYSKPSGYKSVTTQAKENVGSMARYLVGQLQQGFTNTRNQATAQQLSDLLANLYFKKNY